MQLDTGQWVVIIIAAILIFGYILGYVSNRRRAEQIFAWLKKGLSTLGTVSLGEKLPGMATGGRLEVNQPSTPLRRVEVVYVLAPRENLLFWVFHTLQGRGDELIVWITYQSRPEQSVEVARRGDRQFDKRLQSTDKVKLTRLDAPKNIQIAAEEVHGAHQASKVREFVEHHRTDIIRLALRPEKPHLYLRLNLRIMQHRSAGDFLAELKELGE